MLKIQRKTIIGVIKLMFVAQNVLDICLQKVLKIIYASSSEVYGEPLTNPISEEFKTYPKSIYAQTKLMGEGLVNLIIK